ncbi:MAG: phosphoribosyltransferase [Planctomycetota bacterium]
MSATDQYWPIELPELRDRLEVFRDRHHAGEVLAELLTGYRGSDAIVLAIPAGGVPVAAPLARELDLPLDVAVVSKITLPWNTEVGCGAVAFDGTTRINEGLVSQVGLDRPRLEAQARQTRQKVARRMADLRGEAPMPRLADRPAILVDDGLASGFTMRVAVEALQHSGASRVVVAVPTGPARSVMALAGDVSELYCANVRSGPRFAVASAYEHWHDVTEGEARRLLADRAGG